MCTEKKFSRISCSKLGIKKNSGNLLQILFNKSSCENEITLKSKIYFVNINTESNKAMHLLFFNSQRMKTK